MKIKKVEINGYGCLNEGLSVDFVDGINVIYGPNEIGKSTFISAITNIIFGETNNEYIPWRNPEKFGGAVTFENNEITYRILRNFISKDIVLETYDNEGAVKTQKNYKRLDDFKREMAEIFVISDESLFKQVFLIRQQAIVDDLENRSDKELLRNFLMGVISNNCTRFINELRANYLDITKVNLDTMKTSRAARCRNLLGEKTELISAKKKNYQQLCGEMEKAAAYEKESVRVREQLIILNNERSNKETLFKTIDKFVKIIKECKNCEEQLEAIKKKKKRERNNLSNWNLRNLF